MKNKILSFIRAAVLTCVLMISAVVPAYAETEDYGPGIVTTSVPELTVEADSNTIGGIKGESLGIFSTTGYCSCEQCSGGHNLTYSGTVPQAKHTISADISRFPIGTKLIIDDVIYTVEDMGSAVTGNKVDIFYASHEAALKHGRKNQEVFAVIEPTMTAPAPTAE